jgi:GntR family transcriptional regulator
VRRGHLTERVRDELVQRIVRREFAPGQQLPTERDLSTEFGVSRVTVRRAIAALTDEGVVFAVQGRGTFVRTPHLAEPPNVLLSFHDLVAHENVTVTALPLHVDVRPATVREAEKFAIAPGAALFRLERLRYLDGLPVALDVNLLPLALDPALPGADWTHESLYARLGAAGHAPARADYAVEAQVADAARARVLACEPGAPLLVAESDAYEGSGRLVVEGLISYRGDRYRFHSSVTAQGQRVVPARERGRS